MADAADNNGANGGAGENPEEEEEALVEGMGALALKQPQEDLAQLTRVFLKLRTTGVLRDYPQWVLWTQKFKVPSVENSELANVPPIKPAEGPPVHITHINAQRGEEAFKIFVWLPENERPQASDRSVITYVGNDVHFHRHVVQSENIEDALDQFFEFLRTDQPVLLFGHNISRYGGHHLLRKAIACGKIEQMSEVIHGYVDTCRLFRSFAPNLGSYTFKDLCRHYLPIAEPYNDRDPESGARALQRIVARAEFPDETLLQHFYSF